MNKYTKHTPGPWEVDESEIFARGDYFVARVQANQYTPNTDKRKAVTSRNFSLSVQDEANARLIAAAPDLLDALETIAAGNTDPDRVVEIAAEAIAKVEGGAA
jgi:hypothetical protein